MNVDDATSTESACTDLRGHGDSDTTFSFYGDEDTSGDVVALIASGPRTSTPTAARSWPAFAGRDTPERSR